MEDIAIKGLKGKRVALQFPEGLRHRALGLARRMEERNGCEVVILGDPCFGACDLPSPSTLAGIGADVLVHVGHLPLPRAGRRIGRTRVIFMELKTDIDLGRLFDVLLKGDAREKLGARIGLTTTAQHIHQLDDVAAWLEKRGIRTERAKWGSRSCCPGHVIGCSQSGAVRFRGSSILFIGTGTFHPLGLALAASVPVFQYDPERGEVTGLADAKDRFLRQRFVAIERARDAKRFGVLVSSKPGQSRVSLARRARKALINSGREATVVAVDEVRPELLDYMDADAWVSTACPRIAFDDAARFKKPILTFFELEIMLGKRRWEDYVPDSFG